MSGRMLSPPIAGLIRTSKEQPPQWSDDEGHGMDREGLQQMHRRVARGEEGAADLERQERVHAARARNQHASARRSGLFSTHKNLAEAHRMFT